MSSPIPPNMRMLLLLIFLRGMYYRIRHNTVLRMTTTYYSQEALTKRRGNATCQDICDLPPGKRVLIEINDECQPCNIPECTLLASYLMERAAQNLANIQKQKCHHTMGRTSSVRRQIHASMTDLLLLWKLNKLHKDGSWVSEDVKQKWDLACTMLAESNLMLEDRNAEANERVFRTVMGPEHTDRVRCKGFGMTPSKYYPQSSTSTTGASYMTAGSFERVCMLETEVAGLRIEMKQNIGHINKTLNKMYSIFMEKSKKKSKRTRPPSSSDEEEDDDDDDDEDDS